MLKKVVYTVTIVIGLRKLELRVATLFTCSASSFLTLFLSPPDVTLLSPALPVLSKAMEKNVFLAGSFYMKCLHKYFPHLVHIIVLLTLVS
jgi:hypothetical protein